MFRVLVLELEGHGVGILGYAHVGGGNRGLGYSQFWRPICMINRPVSRGASGELSKYSQIKTSLFNI